MALKGPKIVKKAQKKNRPKNDAKTMPKQPQNDPKRCKIIRKWPQNDPKVTQKSSILVPKRAKNGPKTAKNVDNDEK